MGDAAAPVSGSGPYQELYGVFSNGEMEFALECTSVIPVVV